MVAPELWARTIILTLDLNSFDRCSRMHSQCVLAPSNVTMPTRPRRLLAQQSKAAAAKPRTSTPATAPAAAPVFSTKAAPATTTVPVVNPTKVAVKTPATAEAGKDSAPAPAPGKALGIKANGMAADGSSKFRATIPAGLEARAAAGWWQRGNHSRGEGRRGPEGLGGGPPHLQAWVESQWLKVKALGEVLAAKNCSAVLHMDPDIVVLKNPIPYLK